MIRILFSAFFILFITYNAAFAGEKVIYQNWAVDLGDKTSEAYTIADANSSLGVFCSGEQCLFYLRQGLHCAPGTQYSVLINSATLSTAIGMECTLIGGNLFQILSPFEAVLRASQMGEGIGFAVALQSGAFAVSRFSLLGAKPAIDRVLAAAAARNQKTKPVPQPPLNSAPTVKPQSPSKDISI